MSEAIFPLPLTPFEHYMLADDRPDHPMTCVEYLYFEGVLDRLRLERAFEEALRHQPLLRARIAGCVLDRTSHLHWIDADASPRIKWTDSIEQLRPGPPVDLFAGPGLRLSATDSAAMPTMLLEWHHACCDGIGIHDFVDSLLTAYRDGRLDGRQLARDRKWWLARSHRKSVKSRPWFRVRHDWARIAAYFRNRTQALASFSLLRAIRGTPLPPKQYVS